MLPAIPDEGRLILCCARTTVDPDSLTYAKTLIEKDLDWKAVKQFASFNRVVPLFYNGLLKACPNQNPRGFLNDIGELASKYAVRNEKSLKLLLHILDLFEGNGIPAVPFKGVAFALSQYGDLKLRQCGDIDILVQRKNFLRAKDILIREGFNQLYFGHHESATVQAALSRSPGNEVIDLHYGITPNFYPILKEAMEGSRLENTDRNKRVKNLTYWHFSLDSEALWTRLIPLDISGRRVSVFSPEDTLINAIVQGVKEAWLTLRRICDVAELLRANPSLDWDLVLARAHELKFEKNLCFGLFLAYCFLGAPLDERPLRMIQKYFFIGGLAAHTQIMLFRENDEIDRHAFRMSSNFLTMDSYREKLRYLRFVGHRLRIKNELGSTLRRYRAFLRMSTMPIVFKLRSRSCRGLDSNTV